MKKLSFFLMAMLFSVMSFAAEVTVKISDYATTNGWKDATQYKTLKMDDNVSITVAGSSNTGKYYTNGNNWRMYQNESPKITLTATNGNLLKTVKFTYAAEKTGILVDASKAQVKSGTVYTFADEVTTYTFGVGNTGTATNGQVRFTEITVVYDAPTPSDPDAVKYTVTAKVNDPAMGTVSGAGEIEEGKTATLTANANAGYKFVNWSNGSTDNPLKITVTENVEITANFEAVPTMTCAEAAAAAKGATVVLNPFDVVYVVKGAGYTYIKDDSGVNLIFDYTMDDQFKAGDHVEGFVGTSSPYNGLPEIKPTVSFADLKVTPGTAPEATVFETVPAKEDVNKYVVFKGVKLTSNISYTTGSATNATISVGGKNVTLRNQFKLAASLTSGSTYDIYAFVAVYNGNIQMYYASSVDVSPERTITATVNPAETGTVTGAGTYKEGKTATLKATPAEGYAFTCWTEGEDTVSTAANYSFKVAADRALVANFAKKTYNVTVTAENGTVEGAGEYEEGKEATLTATANEGYEFTCWTSGEDTVSTANPYTFAVTANVALVANFKKSVVTHDFYVEDVTVTEGQWSIDLAGSWNEQAFVLKLWQDNTQGFGTYAANAETGYAATLGVKELTPTAEGNFMQDPMNENAFIFQGTMTDGTDIYEVFLKGALPSSTGTGEMEAKDDVAFSCDADGVWTIEAYADDMTWGLALNVAQNPETMEWIATGYYITNLEAEIMEEVAGTCQLYFDDFSGCYVFKGGLATASGNIYPTLYASSLTLMTNDLVTGPSWVGEFAGVDYYEVLMMAADYSWELDLHARNCTGANGTYTIDVVDEAEGAYSTFMDSTIVTGELTIEDGMYEANVTTVDSEGNPAMSISVLAWEAEAAEYNVVIENATVTKNNAGYNIDLTGEWEGHDIKVEVCDELTAKTIWANFFIDGGIANGGDQAEGKVTATVSEGVVTIAGAFECPGSGNVYNVTISGKLPEGVSTDLENNTITVKAAKVIRNGKLIIRQGDVEFNAQGAIIK